MRKKIWIKIEWSGGYYHIFTKKHKKPIEETDIFGNQDKLNSDGKLNRCDLPWLEDGLQAPTGRRKVADLEIGEDAEII